MKKRFFALIIGVIATAGVTVYNYTGEDITLENGEVIKSRDLPTHTTKKYRERDLNVSDSLTIYIHHTAVRADASLEAIAGYHVNHNGWPGVGYHSAVNPDGDAFILNNLETISYHTRGDNTKGISIVLLGNYNTRKLTDDQIETLQYLTDAICSVLPIKAIKGHRDARNASTSCPGNNAYKELEFMFYD